MRYYYYLCTQEIFYNMSKLREIVYIVLDEIKAANGDSTITEEHVRFLANQYRIFLLEQKKKKEGALPLSSANTQTICLNLEQTDAIPDLEYCNDLYLRSIEEIPALLDSDSAQLYTYDQFNIRFTLVSKDRFKFVGNNKWMRDIIYATLGGDDHLYLRSMNPQFKYLKTAKITGVFEDAEEAATLSCDDEGNKCDVLDSTFPLEADLIPQMIELIVKELLGANYRPKDEVNNAADDLADIASFVRRNMKSPIAKQMTQ